MHTENIDSTHISVICRPLVTSSESLARPRTAWEHRREVAHRVYTSVLLEAATSGIN